MKHWVEGRIQNTVFLIFSPIYFAIFILKLHKLNNQNVLFTVFSCFKKKNYYKKTIYKYLLNTEFHFYILLDIAQTKHNWI